MPEIVIPMHEFYDRHGEIPDTPDCYLVGMWNEDIPEGDLEAVEEGAFYPTPWLASKVDALSSVRYGMDREDWDYQWGWDPENDPEGSFRVGCNTPSVGHPVYMRFRWGEDTTSEDGIKMLLCESADWDSSGQYCKHCHRERTGKPRDCPTLRLRAMAKAVLRGTAGVHVKAVQKWHQPEKGKR